MQGRLLTHFILRAASVETRWRSIHDAGLKEDNKANIIGAGGQRKEGPQEGLERDGRPTRLSATRMHGVSAHANYD